MDSGSLFPGMVNTVGALLPALISVGFVAARLTRSRLRPGSQLWSCVFALAISVAFARVEVTPDAISLYFPPGATVVLCYLVWCGYYIPPCMAFAFTYASMLPVDVVLAKLASGPHFNPEGIGGAGWLDGLLIFPSLTFLGDRVCQLAHGKSRACRVNLVWTAHKGTRLAATRKSGHDHWQTESYPLLLI